MQAGSGGLQQGQRQLAGGARLVQQAGSHVQAGPAVGAAAGTHGQLSHAVTTGKRGFTDLVIGNPIADTDVHGAVLFKQPSWLQGIQTQMRMVVNFER
ncbi:hypothetical protein D3C81_1352100 [compost metagenome]